MRKLAVVLLIVLILIALTGCIVSVTLQYEWSFPDRTLSHTETIRALENVGIDVAVIKGRIYFRNHERTTKYYYVDYDRHYAPGFYSLAPGRSQDFPIRGRTSLVVKYYRSLRDARNDVYLFRGKIYPGKIQTLEVG